MAERKLTPKVPGEPVNEVSEDNEVNATEATLDTAGEAKLDTTGIIDALDDALGVEALSAQVASLTARVAALESAMAEQPTARTEKARTTGRLPHPDEIDPDKIRSPVLTTEGWVSPSGFGSQQVGAR